VLSDVVRDVSPIDWIQIRGRAPSRKGSVTEQAGWVSARGGCDLRAVCHYFSLGALRSSGEFNRYRHGCDIRLDHSMFLRYAISGLLSGGMVACKRLGYDEEDFRTYMGTISEALFKENLKIILNAAPRNTRVFILGANEHFWDAQANIRHQSVVNKSLNR
jgi:hypothetical protein